jgi:hypothetical protein
MDVEEMKLSSKVDLRDMSWWMYIKNPCRPKVPITTKPFLKGCIFLTTKGKPFTLHVNMTEACVGPFNLRNILF